MINILINQDLLECDDETKQKCKTHSLAINRLVSIFDGALS